MDEALTVMVLDGDDHGTGKLAVKQFGDIVTDYTRSEIQPKDAKNTASKQDAENSVPETTPTP